MCDRNGEGREYYDNGSLKLEGIYKYGTKHGKIKEYNINGKLIKEFTYKYGRSINDPDRFESYIIHEYKPLQMKHNLPQPFNIIIQ